MAFDHVGFILQHLGLELGPRQSMHELELGPGQAMNELEC